MIRKFAHDIISICLIVLVAFMLEARPDINQNTRQQTVLPKVVEQKTSEAGLEQKSSSKAASPYKELEARNLFAANGSYKADEAAAKTVIPENPYTLIGILRGKETRALFREYTGSVISMKAGEKMIDGSVIDEIGRTSVKLKMGDEKREQKMFNIQSLMSGAGK